MASTAVRVQAFTEFAQQTEELAGYEEEYSDYFKGWNPNSARMGPLRGHPCWISIGSNFTGLLPPGEMYNLGGEALRRMSNRTILFLSILFTAVATLAACSRLPLPATPTASPLPELPVAFPRQPQPDGERAVMEALTGGRLALVDGCIRLAERGMSESYLLIWPPGFSLALEGETPVILDEQGRRLAQVGDWVAMGGGEVPLLAQLADSVQAQVPPACTGRFWVIGDGFHPVTPPAPTPNASATPAWTATPAAEALPTVPKAPTQPVQTPLATVSTGWKPDAPVALAALQDHRLVFACLDGGVCLPEVDLSQFDILAEPYALDAVYYWDPTSVYAIFYAENTIGPVLERMVVHLNPQTGVARATGLPEPLNTSYGSLVRALAEGRLVMVNEYQDTIYILDRDLGFQTVAFGTGITGLGRRSEALVETGGSQVLAYNRVPAAKYGGLILEAALIDVLSGQVISTEWRLPEMELSVGPRFTPQPGSRYFIEINAVSPDLELVTLSSWTATEPATLWLSTYVLKGSGLELAATDNNLLVSVTHSYLQYRDWLYSGYSYCVECGDSSRARLIDMPGLSFWLDPQQIKTIAVARKSFIVSPFGEGFLLDQGGQVVLQSFGGEILGAWPVPAEWLERNYRLVQVRR